MIIKRSNTTVALSVVALYNRTFASSKLLIGFSNESSAHLKSCNTYVSSRSYHSLSQRLICSFAVREFVSSIFKAMLSKYTKGQFLRDRCVAFLMHFILLICLQQRSPRNTAREAKRGVRHLRATIPSHPNSICIATVTCWETASEAYRIHGMAELCRMEFGHTARTLSSQTIAAKVKRQTTRMLAVSQRASAYALTKRMWSSHPNQPLSWRTFKVVPNLNSEVSKMKPMTVFNSNFVYHRHHCRGQ